MLEFFSKNTSPLFKAITSVSAISLLYSALNFGANVLISRGYGVDSFAAYSLYSAICTFAALVCAGGFDAIVMRSTDEQQLQHHIRQANLSITILSALSTVPIAIYLCTQSEVINVGIVLTYVITIYLLAHNLFKQGIAAYVDAQARFQAIEKICRSIIFLIFLFFGQVILDRAEDATIYLFCFSLIITYVITNLFLAKQGQPALLFSLRLDTRLVAPTILLTGSSVLINLLTTIDLVAISYLGSNLQIAQYSAAQKLAIVSSLITYAVNIAIVPTLLKQKKNKSKTGLTSIRQAVKFSILCSTIYLLACVFCGKMLLGIFSPEYKDAYWALVFLAIANLISVSFGQTYTLMRIHGQERQLIFFIGMTATIKTTFLFILFPLYGISGVAAASIGAALMWNALSYYHLLNKLGIDATARGR